MNKKINVRAYHHTTVAITLVVICAIISGCSQSSDEAHQSTTASVDVTSPTPPANLVVQAPPDDESNLLATWDQAVTSVLSGKNEIVTSQLEDKWGKIYCSTISKIHDFGDWTAQVQGIHDTGYFEVGIGNGISLSESVSSSEPMFATISGLRVGEAVKISGTIDQNFVHDTCLGYSSLTSPNYPVHFISVVPISQ